MRGPGSYSAFFASAGPGRVWPAALLAGFGLAFLALVACRGAIGVDDAGARASPAGIPTAAPTATAPAISMDCDVIRRAQTFAHALEQDWFLATCPDGPLVSEFVHGYNRLYGAGGARIFEVYSVPEDVCENGRAGLTLLHAPYLEAFSYLFGTFCVESGSDGLGTQPPPLRCEDGSRPTSLDVRLPYLDGTQRSGIEVFCAAADEPEETGSPSTGAEAPPADFAMMP